MDHSAILLVNHGAVIREETYWFIRVSFLQTSNTGASNWRIESETTQASSEAGPGNANRQSEIQSTYSVSTFRLTQSIRGSDAPDALIRLNPGEWIRVKARVEFNLRLPPAGTINLEPAYWLRDVTFHPHPGGFSREAKNICINEKPAPSMLVHRN